MTTQEFLEALARLTRNREGRLLMGCQSVGGGVSPLPFEGTAHPNCTHVNTALFTPTKEGAWRELGRLTTQTAFLILDDVGNPEKAPNTPKVTPTWKVETSPGSEQWGYAYASGLDIEDALGMTGAAVAAGLSDDFIEKRHHHWFRPPGSLPPPKIAEGKTEPARLLDWTGKTFGRLGLAHGLGIEPQSVSYETYRGSSAYHHQSGALDPVMRFLRQNLDITGPDRRGFHDVPCPRFHLHTDPGRPWARYVPPNLASPAGFTCFHAHCIGLNIDHFRDFIEEMGGPTAKQSRTWSARVAAFRDRLKKLPPEQAEARVSAWLATFDPEAMRVRLAQIRL